MRVQMIGCSHHNSSVAVRERLAFSPTQARQALDRFREAFPETEAVLISTCNRIEIYTAVEERERAPTHEQIAEFLADFHGLKLYEIFDDLFERHRRGRRAAPVHRGGQPGQHGGRRAADLAQVKQAYNWPMSAQSTGPLTQVFQAALRVARGSPRETSIHQNASAFPAWRSAISRANLRALRRQAACSWSARAKWPKKRCAICRTRGPGDVTVVNRSFDRAEQLAARWRGRAAPWEELLSMLTSADLVISTTGAERPVVTLADYQRIEAAAVSAAAVRARPGHSA